MVKLSIIIIVINAAVMEIEDSVIILAVNKQRFFCFSPKSAKLNNDEQQFFSPHYEAIKSTIFALFINQL